jgi:hypothetical protein
MVVPAFWDLRADEGQNEICDLLAEEKASKTILVLEIDLT